MENESLTAPERLKSDVEHLKDWLAKEPHLPEIEDDEWLATFLFHNKFSLEKTKLKLDGYFSVRNRYPEVLKNRDPLGPDIEKAAVAYNQSYASRLTKNGERVLFARPSADSGLFNATNHLRRIFMMCDLIYLEHDRHSAVMTVTDCTHLSYQHFLKGFPLVKVASDIFTAAYSERMKAFHLINTPTYINTIVEAIKKIIPEKFTSRVFVHASSDSLKEFVDEEVLCSDFGGKGPPFAEYDEHTRKLLEKHRKWFLEQDSICADERLRRKDENHIDELRGSFRKLDVD
nr:PREDICTED: clavesin-2-like [Bemisia tabaci]